MHKKSNKGLNIGVKSFITALVVIFVLMVATYALTLVIPGGNYERVPDENGNLIIDTNRIYPRGRRYSILEMAALPHTRARR